MTKRLYIFDVTQMHQIQDYLISAISRIVKFYRIIRAYNPCQWHVPMITNSPDSSDDSSHERTSIETKAHVNAVLPISKKFTDTTERYNHYQLGGFLVPPQLSLTYPYHRWENPTRLITEDVEETCYAYLLMPPNEFSPFNTQNVDVFHLLGLFIQRAPGKLNV